jgi:hypothetical protein
LHAFAERFENRFGRGARMPAISSRPFDPVDEVGYQAACSAQETWAHWLHRQRLSTREPSSAAQRLSGNRA